MPAITAHAATHGLSLCPLELGLHLRLQYRDQPEGQIDKPGHPQHAPYGSITVVSEPLSTDDDLPKGFYLRGIAGVLWLRGYRSTPEHRWPLTIMWCFVWQTIYDPPFAHFLLRVP
jgi:hypothetical protein